METNYIKRGLRLKISLPKKIEKENKNSIVTMLDNVTNLESCRLGTVTVGKNLYFVEDPGGQKEILHFVNLYKGMLRMSPHLRRTK